MAAVELTGIRFDARDADLIATFWAQILDWRLQPAPGGAIAVLPTVPGSYPLLIDSADTPKRGQNRIHFDLTTTSAQAMQELIAQALDLGASHADVGQAADVSHGVLADPEGNEFCVIEPESWFLADTGAIGAINCDGSQAVGYFWSEVLQWPLVWDQDEETAIQAPIGGSKITWSGPPLMPRIGRDRLRFELTALDPLPRDIADLAAKGATIGIGPRSGQQVVMLDPDGNEFHVVER